MESNQTNGDDQEAAKEKEAVATLPVERTYPSESQTERNLLTMYALHPFM
jgi:hypothetical protein